MRRRAEVERICLVVAAITTSACELIGTRPMVPASSARLTTVVGTSLVNIERIHVDYTSKKPTHRVDVRIQYMGYEEVRVSPEKIEVIERGPAKFNPRHYAPGRPRTLEVDPSTGRTVEYVVDASRVEGSKTLRYAESATYRIVLPQMRLDDGRNHALALDAALGLQGTHFPNALPLVRPNEPHGGYLPPSEPAWVFSGRLGGGIVRRAPYTGGLGGFEVFVGRQWGRLSVGGFGTLGAGAWGAEMRLRFEPARVLSIVPLFGYGYYPLVGYLGFNAGHGARWGVELQFSTGETVHFGYSRNTKKVGLYALGGPVFLRGVDGAGFAGQVGFCFGIF